MKIQNVCYRGHPAYSFHGDEAAEILGIRMVTPEGLEARLVLWVRYKNGDEDFVSLNEAIDMGYITTEFPKV